MLKKPCPWCNRKISNWNLGNKPRTARPKWYELTRHLQVCPYCCGEVKLGGKAMYSLLAFLPVFLLLPLQLIFGKEVIDIGRYGWPLFILAGAGFVFALLFSSYEKDHDA